MTEHVQIVSCSSDGNDNHVSKDFYKGMQKGSAGEWFGGEARKTQHFLVNALSVLLHRPGVEWCEIVESNAQDMVEWLHYCL